MNNAELTTVEEDPAGGIISLSFFPPRVVLALGADTTATVPSVVLLVCVICFCW